MAELKAEQKPIFDFAKECCSGRLLALAPTTTSWFWSLHTSLTVGRSGTHGDLEFYAAFAAGQQAQVPEPALQFCDFARWQREWTASATATQQFAYWKTQLRGASPVFPTNDAVSSSLLGSRIAHEPVHVPDDLVARLGSLSNDRGATLFMTLLAGFKTLLLARSGREDICVATAMANRSQLQMERVIGPLVNTTLIRTKIDADLSFEEAMHRVRHSVLEAYSRQELPYDVLVPRLADEDGLDPASLIQVFFVLQNAFR